MNIKKTLQKSAIRNEAVLLVGLLIFGIICIPGAVYLVGQLVFGDFAGEGFGDFFASISTKLMAADGAAWLLVASPYLVLQCLRLTRYGWRQIGASRGR